MRRIVLGVLALTGSAFANPISVYQFDPPYTMVAENVIVGVSADGAVVFGNYRFHTTPDTPKYYIPPYKLALELPVPVPSAIQGFDAVSALVHPILKIKGAIYYPFKSGHVHYFEEASLPRGIRLVVFSYFIERTDLDQEVEVQLQYDQPILRVDGKEVVYYVPYLPGFARYEKAMSLSPHSFVVNFESYKGVTLKLAQPVTDIAQQLLTLISVYAKNEEVIAVERRPNQLPDPPSPTVTPPASAGRAPHVDADH